MISRLEERRRIAEVVREMMARQESINAHPEVVAAREAAAEARRIANDMDAKFSRVFNKHYPRDRDILSACREIAPDVVVASSEMPLLCEATGLPIFEGDEIFTSDTDSAPPHAAATLVAAVSPDAPRLLQVTIAKNEGAEDEDSDEGDDEFFDLPEGAVAEGAAE